jgi:hypothetical protein
MIVLVIVKYLFMVLTISHKTLTAAVLIAISFMTIKGENVFLMMTLTSTTPLTRPRFAY